MDTVYSVVVPKDSSLLPRVTQKLRDIWTDYINNGYLERGCSVCKSVSRCAGGGHPPGPMVCKSCPYYGGEYHTCRIRRAYEYSRGQVSAERKNAYYTEYKRVTSKLSENLDLI